ncbi:MAG: type I methionyl aminopeptidase [Shewanellaceae bacterium]|nr:type I methionyl aminopeptidase [Shewanellaceae bacterium]
MNILIKSKQEIEHMREAGRLAAEVLDMITPHVKPGISTHELDEICHRYITEIQDAVPAPLNYHGFPKSICTSINHVVCHGIPKKQAVLKDGDIINIDVTVIKNNYHGDTSKMFMVGQVSEADRRLCRITQEALYLAIKKIKPGVKLSEIGTTIEKFIKKSSNTNQRFSIVKDYCGHGIGVGFHEDPQIVHYKNNDQTVLQPGMCFTIEPMINLGRAQTVLDKDDNWTVYTVDGKKSAQWEHTLLVTTTGVEILTHRQEETISQVIAATSTTEINTATN